jgi:hypothetical protein
MNMPLELTFVVMTLYMVNCNLPCPYSLLRNGYVNATRGGNFRIIYVLDYFTIHGIKFNSKLFFEILFMDSIGMYNVYNNPPKKIIFTHQ